MNKLHETSWFNFRWRCRLALVPLVLAIPLPIYAQVSIENLGELPAPQIQAAVVDCPVLWSPNHKMVPIELDLLVSDTCTAPQDLILVCQVQSNEPDDANGDGSFTGDVDGADGFSQPVNVSLSCNPDTGRWEGLMFLRAERDGGGDGRHYSIRCIAADPSGNMTYATVCVTVPKSRGRGNR